MSRKTKKTDLLKRVYVLDAVYDSRVSFYNKALVYEDDEIAILYSYMTPVAIIDKAKNHYCLNSDIDYDLLLSNTTMRHIKEFLKQLLHDFNFTKRVYDAYIYSNKKIKNYDAALKRYF